MDSWARRITGILDRAPTRALPYSRLLAALEEEGVPVSGREDWIFQRMLEMEDLFRLVPDRLGAWVHWPDSLEGHRGMGGLRLRGGKADPWVMARKRPTPEMGTWGQWAGRIRETLHAWGEDVDEGSQVAVARWIGANGEAEKALEGWFSPEEEGR